MRVPTANKLALAAATHDTHCLSQPPLLVTPITWVANGDVALAPSPGVWFDSTGGVWVEPTGALTGGPSGPRISDLEPRSISGMSDANIAAHLATGDSLVMALSAAGAKSAHNGDVREFAERMMIEHKRHRDTTHMMLRTGRIAPVLAPFDTTDAAVGARMITHLAALAASGSNDYDRQFMGAEVALHQHMLSEVSMFREQASDAAQPLLRETKGVMQAHMLMARRLHQELGGAPELK